MQLSARWKAVLELMKEVFQDERPADNIINEYFRARKYIGSGDRRFITEHIWNVIRNRRKLEFDAGSSHPRDVLIAYVKDESTQEIFAGGEYGLEPLNTREKEFLYKVRHNEEPYPIDVEAECPKWLFDKIKDVELCKALNKPAPADFRVNVKNRETLIEKLEGEGLEFAPTTYSPIGLRSQSRVNLNNCVAYKEGELDVQDEASQIAAILADPKENEKIIDYCCGAGGKALTMAYLMNNKGKIYAHDINWGRLEAIKDRADRLGVSNIEIVKKLEDDDFDLFLLDAPCSGSGTWRRSPDAKFRLDKEKLEEFKKTQKELLNFASDHVKVGGRIVYITCSILQDEDEDVILKFLKRNENFKIRNMKNLWNEKLHQPYPCTNEQSLRMNPLTTGTDGFFVTVLVKTSD